MPRTELTFVLYLPPDNRSADALRADRDHSRNHEDKPAIHRMIENGVGREQQNALSCR